MPNPAGSTRRRHSKPCKVVCLRCKRMFDSNAALEQHRAAKHGETPNAEHITLMDVPVGKTAENERWSIIPIDEHREQWDLLSQSCHSLSELPQSYRREKFSRDEIDGYSRCRNCKGVKRRVEGKIGCAYHTRGLSKKNSNEKPMYLCCNTKNAGCVTATSHEYVPPGKLLSIKLQKFKATPDRQYKNPRECVAIALDCEMVSTIAGQYPVSISAIDYLTGSVLINYLITPSVRVLDWRTKFSGITEAMVTQAVTDGTALPHWEAARALLWTYMTPQTILIGQSLSNDLNALGMVHTRVVDSEILTRHAVGKEFARSWGLKRLCGLLLGITIQEGEGHDSLEDAFAAREVVLWCLNNTEKLAAWAGEQRNALIQEQNAAKERAKIKEAKKEAKGKAKENEHLVQEKENKQPADSLDIES
uniref:RNA exonuclease 3 n=1 Tax=Coccidioides posadasii RMSCC 3488 TaxID=454284 RepID=A0A0J6FQT0_COCPO|nr:RNA exonuclease 3 [Coccidioides posadasii RMSCC 3488]